MAPRETDRLRPSVGVAIVSMGRPATLGECLDRLIDQTVEHRLVVVVPHDDDLPAVLPPGAEVILCGPGIALQRNAALDALAGMDVVFFFDDDAVVRQDYLERALDVFGSHPDVVGITGAVLRDGAQGEAISLPQAVEVLEASQAAPTPEGWRPTHELYGCNFGYRVSAAPALRFDERLLGYSWLEDLDFASQLRRCGTLARSQSCMIVHRGVKSGGRARHRELGFAQVMNPVYMWRKGSFGLLRALRESVPLVAKNALLSVVPAQGAWRRARLVGNLAALADVLTGRIAPERVARMAPKGSANPASAPGATPTRGER